MSNLEPIGNFLVCQNRDRNPISLRRVSEEVVCLGFDPKTNRFVELHVIGDTEQMKGNGKLSFLERAWNAGTMNSHCFQKILAAADDDGMFFYATDINEGEFLTDYIVRNGPVKPNTAVALSLDLIDSLVEVEPHYRLLLGLRLKNLMVVLENSAYLTLRIIDLGLGRPEPRGMNYFETADLLADVSRQLYYLLAGRPYTVGQPGQVEALKDVDSAVTDLLLATIEPETGTVDTFERFQELLESAYYKGAEKLPRRSAIAATPQTRPRLTMQREVFDKIGAKEQLESASFELEPSVGVFEYPYAANAIRKGNGERGRLSWVPPRGIVPSPPQDEGLILLNAFYYRFLTTTTGLSFQEFLIQRNHLPSPIDSILILNGLAEKIDGGTLNDEAFSFHQVWFELPGKSGEEIQETAVKGVDQWPSVSVKILPHSETSVYLNPPTAAKETSDLQLRLSFIEVARELLCEAPDALHDLIDAEASEIKTGKGAANCSELLLKIADALDT